MRPLVVLRVSIPTASGFGNTHLFTVFGKKDGCGSGFSVFRLYSTADAIAPGALGPKLLAHNVAVVKPGKWLRLLGPAGTEVTD